MKFQDPKHFAIYSRAKQFELIQNPPQNFEAFSETAQNRYISTLKINIHSFLAEHPELDKITTQLDFKITALVIALEVYFQQHHKLYGINFSKYSFLFNRSLTSSNWYDYDYQINQLFELIQQTDPKAFILKRSQNAYQDIESMLNFYDLTLQSILYPETLNQAPETLQTDQSDDIESTRAESESATQPSESILIFTAHIKAGLSNLLERTKQTKKRPN